MFRPALAVVLLITAGTAAPCEEPPAASVDVTFLTRDGKPIDGIGVQPDICVDVDTETISGDRDAMLERAVAELDAPNRTPGNK